MKARLAEAARAALHASARAAYPEEACGVLLGRPGEEPEILEAQPLPNLNRERARDRYLIDPAAQLRAERAARDRGLEVLGYFHSHPDHPARPSATDLELSWEQLLYVIVALPASGEGELKAWQRPAGSGAFQEVPLL